MDIPSYSIVALFLLVLATGCSVLPGATSTRTTATTTTLPISAGSATAPTPESANTEPAKIAIFEDRTGSMDKTRTPQLKPEDLALLFDLLLQGGGELAFGRICDRSNRSLIRVRIEQPPVAPANPAEFSAEEGNPFAAAEKRNEYESKAVAHQKALADYNQRQQLWRNQSEQQLKQFKAAIAPMLSQPANCQATDIWGGVQRADLFLNESDTTWSRPPRKVAIFISDGIDNVQTPAVTMKSNAKTIVVNGSASLGSFSSLNPMQFESSTAAFRYVASSRGK